MNVRRPPEAPDDLRRRPGRAFSSKYALALPPPVSGSFATLPRRRAAVAKKQAELRRQALVEVALERQIWVENAEKDRIARTIVRIARRMDGKRRAVIAREDAAFRAGAREAAVAIETCWRRHARSSAWPRVKAAYFRVLDAWAQLYRAAREDAALRARRRAARAQVATPLQTLWRARLARRELARRRRARDLMTRFITEGVIPLQTKCRMLLARRELLRRQRELERRRRAERARQQAYVIATRAVRRWLRWRFLQKVRRCVHLHLARHRLLQRSMQTVASAVARPPVREAVALVAVATACAGASMREAVAVAAERERVAEEQRRWEEELRRQIAAAIEAAKARVATPLQTRFRARRARRRYVAMRAAAVRIAGWRRRLAWARLCAAEARRREEERQRRALQVIWKVVVPWLARRALRFKKRRLAVLRGMIRVKGYARRQATRQDHWWDLAGERALDIAGESYRAAKEAARLATAMAQHAVTVWKQTQELDRRLNMLMIARAQRLAARAAKRVREIDLSGVPKFCRTLPRRFALKRFEDERLQILQRSTQRVAFLRQLAARAPKPAEAAPAPVFKPRWKKPRKRPKTPEPEPAAPPARRATRLLSAVRWGRIQAVHAGTAPTRPPPPPPC